MSDFGLCECGCGERTRLATQNHAKHGWVKGQPLRYVAGHSGRKSPVEYVEKDCGHATPCWVWQRSRTGMGYGNVNLGDSQWQPAHRMIYERHRGPIPDRLHLDHLCRNPPCVNPEHLEPVTSAENSRRGTRAKLNWSAVREIRASADRTVDLARRFGVSWDTIWSVQTERSWQEASDV